MSLVKSDSRDNALEIVEAKDQSDHPYSKISSRMTKSVNRRPRSFRSGNKNIKSMYFGVILSFKLILLLTSAYNFIITLEYR